MKIFWNTFLLFFVHIAIAHAQIFPPVDLRTDVQYFSPQMLKMAKSIPFLVDRRLLKFDGNYYTWKKDLQIPLVDYARDYVIKYTNQKNPQVCDDFKFASRTSLKDVSGSRFHSGLTGLLINKDIILTAGHAFYNWKSKDEAYKCSDTLVVFDYSDSFSKIPVDNVFSCKKILLGNHGPDGDYAVFQIDRSTVNRDLVPLDISENPLPTDSNVFTLGYPFGSPIMSSGVGNLAEFQQFWPNELRAQISVFSGNSGGPLIDSKTNLVVGITVTGYTNPTFIIDDSKKCITWSYADQAPPGYPSINLKFTAALFTRPSSIPNLKEYLP